MKRKFEELICDEKILKALKEFRYDIPLEVQIEAIPHILQGRDLIVKSQTGSGKTAAFAIPICEKIEEDAYQNQAIIIAPTRELAIQVSDEINLIGKHKNIKSIALYGKQAMEIQRRALKEGFQIIVATPGRLIDHLKRKSVKVNDIKYLVIDEADELLNMGFLSQLEEIISKLPKEKITLLFSATIPDEIELTCGKYMKNPLRIEIDSDVPVTDNIRQAYFETEEIKKFDLFKKIMANENPSSCIIFCNTREKVETLGKLMSRDNFSFCEIHGGLDQKIRLNNILKFKGGEYKYLIATDVAARGIHVNKLSHVINYNLPFENESYVHRIGRTGRIGKNGVAITFVTIREYERFKELQDYLGYKIKNMGGTSKFSLKDNPKIQVADPKKQKNKRTKKDSYENNKGFSRIKLDAGSLKAIENEDVLRAVTGIRDVSRADIEAIKIFGKHTFIDVNFRKSEKIVAGLRKKKIKGTIYNVKKV